MEVLKVMIISTLRKGGNVSRVIESVDHKHEQCCCVPSTAQPTWTSGPGTEVYSLGNN